MKTLRAFGVCIANDASLQALWVARCQSIGATLISYFTPIVGSLQGGPRSLVDNGSQSCCVLLIIRAKTRKIFKP